MNRVEFICRISNYPELSTTTSGVNVCRFSIAVPRKFTNQDGEREVDFFNITAWRGLGENIHKYCTKGSKIYIAGELQNRSYEAQDGTKKYATQIVANECEFLEVRRSEDNTEMKAEPINDDSMPF